jgi:ankyrin repeat protein
MTWQEDLVAAVREDDLELARIALDEGASPDGPDEKGRTPLTRADSVEMVRWLLAAGAHVAAEHPQDGDTSVHRAAWRGDVARLELLLDADGRCALETFNDRGMTPLICAVEGEDVAAVTLLLDAGANIEAHHDPSGGDTALLWAVKAKSGQMVKVLLEAGADANHRGERQWSAYNHACEWRESKRHPELRSMYDLLARAARNPASLRRFR